MYSTSCANTHHDVTSSFEVDEWYKIQKSNISRTVHGFSMKKKNSSNVYLRIHFQVLLFFSRGDL